MAPIPRILVVEDDEIISCLIATMLERKGYSVVGQVMSGEEAIIKSAELEPDLVLMDINLGGMSGIECVRQLKPRMPATQIVMLTVFEDTEKIFSALAAGASASDAAEIANHASGIAVGKLGTAPVTRRELLDSVTEPRP